MGFQKSRNIDKLEESIGEKNTKQNLKEDEKNTKQKDLNNVTRKTEKSASRSIDEEKKESLDQSKILVKLLELKTLSKEINKKKVDQVSIRVSDKTFEDIKKITSSGILSQSDFITILVENFMSDIEGE